MAQLGAVLGLWSMALRAGLMNVQELVQAVCLVMPQVEAVK